MICDVEADSVIATGLAIRNASFVDGHLSFAKKGKVVTTVPRIVLKPMVANGEVMSQCISMPLYSDSERTTFLGKFSCHVPQGNWALKDVAFVFHNDEPK